MLLLRGNVMILNESINIDLLCAIKILIYICRNNLPILLYLMRMVTSALIILNGSMLMACIISNLCVSFASTTSH